MSQPKEKNGKKIKSAHIEIDPNSLTLDIWGEFEDGDTFAIDKADAEILIRIMLKELHSEGALIFTNTQKKKYNKRLKI